MTETNDKMELSRSQRFDAAADHIEKHGLWKHGYHKDTRIEYDGSFTCQPTSCALGSLALGGYDKKVQELNQKDFPRWGPFWSDVHALAAYLPNSDLWGHWVPRFNDHADTTADDVVDMFRRAAKGEAEKESESGA